MAKDFPVGAHVVVTGAASGIGRGTAEWLTSAGVRVIALDHHEPDFEVSRYVAVDLADLASIEDVAACLGDLSLHGLCNAAGVPGTHPAEVVARVNYLGLRSLTAALLPQLVPGAAVVNVASVAGSRWSERVGHHAGLARTSAWSEALNYAARYQPPEIDAYRFYKEALIVWSRLYASDILRRKGVRMNCVSPGPVDTPILDDFRASMGAQTVADTIAKTGRAGTPDDVAPAIGFLLGSGSRWIAGLDMPVDGGLTTLRFADSFAPN